ncbi:protein of unknown function [Cupriavidus taiwanensis]|uniref:Uncharacterized protein n=1 Tax=Cupriavidus taiwanensis TaxID=164546 RepID=A0A7Z7NL84_9BURK|nr:protein of unknown function [Cupriavidus taiwanensis]SOZ04013.1 hypothetical protein CBM2597_A50189 [Cupriavidus taiwanensis]SPC08717.1 hypothetical protein CBM2594_A40040 [Cupriavidus taiwanensis]SPD38462.1 protein of unknown function [Cupriavidus taiwanensis]
MAISSQPDQAALECHGSTAQRKSHPELTKYQRFPAALCRGCMSVTSSSRPCIPGETSP